MLTKHEKRKIKKTLQKVFVAVLCTFLISVFFVFPIILKMTSFTDVDYSTPIGEAVSVLKEEDIIKGISETEFGTDKLVTRQQMAAFIYRMMNNGKSAEGGRNVTPFTDLEDPIFFQMISWANKEGIIEGRSENIFDPEGSITLREAYTMLCRALGYKDLEYPDGYIKIAEGELKLNENLGSSLSYKDALTRGSVALLLYNTREVLRAR